MNIICALIFLLLTSCSNFINNQQNTATIKPVTIISVNEKVVIENNNTVYSAETADVKSLEKLAKNFKYVLQIGDQVNILVWGQPELNNPSVNNLTRDPGVIFTIDQQGKIYYPYVGGVKLAGLTPYQARQFLSRSLSKFFKNAEVNLVVVTYANAHIDVLGAVNEPKRIPLTEVPLPITSAITLAGGENKEGNIRNVILKRAHKHYQFDLLSLENAKAQQIIMQPFDTVFVNRYYNKRVYVLGELSEPNIVWLEDERANVADALSATHGLIIQRSNKIVYLLRLDEERNPLVYSFNTRSLSGLILASHFKLKMNDVVYVCTKPIALWNDIIQQILPTVMMGELSTRSASNVGRAKRDFN
jgi:polysaccharide biosynthesis/export protein